MPENSVPAHSFRYPRASRLLKREGYQACYGRGRKYHTPHFIVFVLDRGDQGLCRTGIAVSKKVGNAVRRNRCKRVLREFFRHTLARGCLVLSVDIVVVVKKQAGITLDGHLTARELGPLFERLVPAT